MQPPPSIVSRYDNHVHFYTAADLQRVSGPLPYSLPTPHPLTAYLDRLIDVGMLPAVINHVHLSILPDSHNVFASFDELKVLQAANPRRYGGVRLVGTIKAHPVYATHERLAHPQVIGARIVLHDAPPESVHGTRFCTAQWLAFYARLLPHQHVHIYAKEAATTLRVLRQVPESVPVIIDHLGSCHGERGATEPAYLALLAEAQRRGTVWFKGPGYRTAVDPHTVAQFVTQIVRTLGPDRLLLQASDAPHVGVDHQGVPYAREFDVTRAFEFVDAVARHVCEATRLPVSQLLRGAC
ncbi:amidohydrolase family protein [Pseudomonas poae]|uniref:amidohydrolase family protein n=1 Tax=Pseudomonas poae TaxID=200451 RepID=UPI0030CDABDF